MSLCCFLWTIYTCFITKKLHAIFTSCIWTIIKLYQVLPTALFNTLPGIYLTGPNLAMIWNPEMWIHELNQNPSESNSSNMTQNRFETWTWRRMYIFFYRLKLIPCMDTMGRQKIQSLALQWAPAHNPHLMFSGKLLVSDFVE